jgi:hypothetical protein
MVSAIILVNKGIPIDIVRDLLNVMETRHLLSEADIERTFLKTAAPSKIRGNR